MSSTIIHPPESFKTSLWKNGLGKTTELLAEKISASEQFYWRLSIASVATADIFSDFSGYDRTLILIEGQGITLTHSNGDCDELTEYLDAATFKGDHTTTPTLHNGPIKDFNIMTRRDHCRAKVETKADSQALQISMDGRIALVYALKEEVTVTAKRMEETTIKGRHLLQIIDPASCPYTLRGGAAIIVQMLFGRCVRQAD